MKFKDLPKMIDSHGGYHCNVGLIYLKGWIEDNVTEMNPDFQRGHVWTESQQIAFVEWYLAGGITGKEFYFNGYGYNSGRETSVVCVDGLQRLTALLKFLNNELPVYGTLLKDFEDKIPSVTYTVSVNINNLETRKEVLQWYLQFNGAGTPHTKEELARVKKLLEAEIEAEK